ncbi:TetR/AcrR family transcriptional regulator [Lactiplantibacillus dongliensis]|uniref:TetR/AcrR family transcriptional regulator n=1 Tax=Lactiplantibacillus dongliensis TaxID=2559919 RepID=A0ABW1R2T3_9LACO|nr:TetR/AcrR family transcriptional regulator [Lactiplantibacillus dongliensis]
MVDKRQALFQAAHHLFLTQGFKATNIAQIAQNAGVAVGTFYRYYDSKEALFVKVYTTENEAVKAKIIANVDLDQAPEPLIKTILQQIFQFTNQNTILQEWFTNPKLNALIASHNAQAVEDSVVYTLLLKLIKQWQTQGLMKPEMTQERALSLFNALTVIDFHQSEIQTTDYYQLLTDLITGMLTVILK